MKQFVLVYGNPSEGFTYYGPFDCHADAVAYAATCDDGPWWIADLLAPIVDARKEAA